MNIYVTSECPIKCAKFLDDLMVKEMAKETARILSAAIKLPTAYRTYDLYHPCINWARLTRGNYEWLLEHFRALCEEYELRYRIPAKSSHLYNQFKSFRSKIPRGSRTPFINNSKFKKMTDVNLAYKSDLSYKWVSYKNPPTWYNKGVHRESPKELPNGSKKKAA